MSESTALPSELAEFLEATRPPVTSLYHPTWIKSDLQSDILEIDFENKKATATEKGSSFNISTTFYAPPGRLSAKDTETFKRHLLLLFVSFIDGAIAPSRTKSSVIAFWKAARCLVEYWVVVAPASKLKLGLKAVTLDAISELLSAFKEFGTEGTVDLRGAWEQEFWSVAGQYDKIALDRIEANLEAPIRKAIDLKVTEVAKDEARQDSVDLRRALLVLASHGAYDSYGNITFHYVSALLGISGPRVVNNSHLRFYLRRYSLDDGSDTPLHRDWPRRQTDDPGNRLSREKTTGAHMNHLIAGLQYVARAADSVEELRNSDLANVTEIRQRCLAENKDDEGRTDLIPASISLALIQRCVDWLLNTAPQIEQLVERLTQVPFPKNNGRPAGFAKAMNSAVQTIQHPVLEKYRIESFSDGHCGHAPTSRHSQFRQGDPISFRDLLDVHYGICFSIVALMGCMRKNEVLDLRDDDVDGSALPAVSALLRKMKIDSIRGRRRKPLPRIALKAIRSMIRIRDFWRGKLPFLKGGGAHVFTNMTRSGITAASGDRHVYSCLALVSHFFDLRGGDGKVWRLLPHQLRKSFAMSFFLHGGREKSLPALSWFMGHRSVVETWRYVRSALTGAEITASEAQMATHAVLSMQKSKAIQELRQILMKHFGCKTLSVMSELELQVYLEHLQRKGIYTATPVEIRTAKGRRVTVMISISRAMDATSD